MSPSLPDPAQDMLTFPYPGPELPLASLLPLANNLHLLVGFSQAVGETPLSDLTKDSSGLAQPDGFGGV